MSGTKYNEDMEKNVTWKPLIENDVIKENSTVTCSEKRRSRGGGCEERGRQLRQTTNCTVLSVSANPTPFHPTL